MRWEGQVEVMGEVGNAYRIFVCKLQGRAPFGIPRVIWRDNIKMELKGSEKDSA
jgi:hypothetical protein